MRTAVLTITSVLGLSSCASHSGFQAAHTVVPVSMDQQIRNAVNAGDGDIEIRSLRELVIAEPENLSVRLELGRAYDKRGYPELAIDHYRFALEHSPDSADAALMAAKALKLAGHPEESIAMLDRFTAAHPQSSAAMYSWLGILRDENRDAAGGEKAHRSALAVAAKIGQDSDYLHNNLGYALLQQGRNQEAAVEFRAALKLNPHSIIARDNLGSALVANPKEAILNWQSLNEPAIAHSNLAATLMEQGKYPEARKEVQIALEYNNANPAALANLKLLSELDGKPVSIPVQVSRTRWSRMKTAWHNVFGGSPSAPQANAETASSVSTSPVPQTSETKP